MKKNTKIILILSILTLLLLSWAPWITEKHAIEKVKTYSNFQEQHKIDLDDENLQINVIKTPFCRWVTTYEGGWNVCFWQIF